jgi:hypothetical protein
LLGQRKKHGGASRWINQQPKLKEEGTAVSVGHAGEASRENDRNWSGLSLVVDGKITSNRWSWTAMKLLAQLPNNDFLDARVCAQPPGTSTVLLLFSRRLDHMVKDHLTDCTLRGSRAPVQL